MRRKDREITELGRLTEIVAQCRVCRIAMADEDGLYSVPMNFGYRVQEGRITLYFHSAAEGRKVEALRDNPRVCVEMDCGHQLIEAKAACGYSYAYASLIGWGRARFLSEPEDKKAALAAIMRHQTGRDFAFTDQMAQGVCIFQVELEQLSGKEHAASSQ